MSSQNKANPSAGLSEITDKTWADSQSGVFLETDIKITELEKYTNLYQQALKGRVRAGETSVDDKAFIELIEGHTRQKADAVLEDVIDATKNAPYEEIPLQRDILEEEIGRLSLELADTQVRVEAKIESIETTKADAIRILPELEDEAEELAKKLSKEITQSDREIVNQELKYVKKELEELETLEDITSRAWPVPKLIKAARDYKEAKKIEKREAKKAERAKKAENQDIPKQAAQTKPEKAKKTEQTESEKPKSQETRTYIKDASKTLAEWLTEEPGTAFSFKELAEAVYGDVENINTKTSVVRTLINNYLDGKNLSMSQVIDDSNLVLQMGWRQSIDKDTKQVTGRKVRVLRAITLQQEAENFGKNEATEDYAFSDWENLNDSKAIKEKLSKSEEPIDLQDGDTIDLQPEKGSDSAEFRWQNEFQEAVNDVISRLSSEGVLIDQPIVRKVLRQISGSSIAGTKTSIERGIKNKIITKNQSGINAELHPWQVVALALQNTNGKVLSNRRWNRTAIDMIKQSVDQFFKDQK